MIAQGGLRGPSAGGNDIRCAKCACFLKHFEKHEVIPFRPTSIWKKRAKVTSETMKCYVSKCLNGDCLSQNAVNSAMHNA